MSDQKKVIDASQKSGVGATGDQTQHITLIDKYYSGDYGKLATINDGHITFDPSHLKDIIVTIDEGIQGIDETPLDFSPGTDLAVKNEINNHSQEYFENIVELEFYPQFKKIDKFLALRVNQETLQPRIDRIIKSLNRRIQAFQGEHRFEVILLKIADKLIDSRHETLGDKDHEILLVLYYFYCNCCIGKKKHNV